MLLIDGGLIVTKISPGNVYLRQNWRQDVSDVLHAINLVRVQYRSGTLQRLHLVGHILLQALLQCHLHNLVHRRLAFPYTHQLLPTRHVSDHCLIIYTTTTPKLSKITPKRINYIHKECHECMFVCWYITRNDVSNFFCKIWKGIKNHIMLKNGSVVFGL